MFYAEHWTPSPPSRRQMLFQIPRNQRVDVQQRTWPLGNSMCPIRVLHKIELLSKLHQPIDQLLVSLEMHIVVAAAMDDQQFPLQAFRETDWRSIAIALRVLSRQPHV